MLHGPILEIICFSDPAGCAEWLWSWRRFVRTLGAPGPRERDVVRTVPGHVVKLSRPWLGEWGPRGGRIFCDQDGPICYQNNMQKFYKHLLCCLSFPFDFFFFFYQNYIKYFRWTCFGCSTLRSEPSMFGVRWRRSCGHSWGRLGSVMALGRSCIWRMKSPCQPDLTCTILSCFINILQIEHWKDMWLKHQKHSRRSSNKFIQWSTRIRHETHIRSPLHSLLPQTVLVCFGSIANLIQNYNAVLTAGHVNRHAASELWCSHGCEAGVSKEFVPLDINNT